MNERFVSAVDCTIPGDWSIVVLAGLIVGNGVLGTEDMVCGWIEGQRILAGNRDERSGSCVHIAQRTSQRSCWVISCAEAVGMVSLLLRWISIHPARGAYRMI